MSCWYSITGSRQYVCEKILTVKNKTIHTIKTWVRYKILHTALLLLVNRTDNIFQVASVETTVICSKHYLLCKMLHTDYEKGKEWRCTYIN